MRSPAPRGLPDDVDVTGVLAFFDGDWPFFPPNRNKGVRLEVRDPRSSSAPAKGPTP